MQKETLNSIYRIGNLHFFNFSQYLKLFNLEKRILKVKLKSRECEGNDASLQFSKNLTVCNQKKFTITCIVVSSITIRHQF